MGYVEELGRRGATDGAKGVPEHGVAERTGGADGLCPGGDEFLSTDVADAGAAFFAKEDEAAAGSATEAAFAVAIGFDEGSGGFNDGSGFVVDVLVATEVAGVVVNNVLPVLFGELVGVAGHELGVMLDFRGDAVLAPIGGDGANAVRADGDDLFDLRLFEGGKTLLGEGAEDQIVAEAAGGVASTLFLFHHTERCSKVLHDAGKVGYDLAALGVKAAHAAQPEAVLLRAVEDGEALLGNEFIALHGAEPEGVALAFEGEEELGAIGVFPGSGVDGSAAETDDDGEMLDADRALELAGAAGGALEGSLHGEEVCGGVVRGRVRRGVAEFVEERGFAGRAEGAEVGPHAENDFFGVEDLAGGGSGAMLGAAAAFDATIGFEGDELGDVFAGYEAEIFVSDQRLDLGEAVALEKDGERGEDEV